MKSIGAIFREHGMFACMLVVTALLRFLPLFDYQFTYDELSGLDRTRFNSFSDLIEKGVKIDAHPALIQLVIFLLVKCFGYVNWVLKLPFLLCGFGTMIYAYRLGWKHFGKQSALMLTAFVSFSLVFVYYAPIARMYGPGMFFSMALLYYFLELVFGQRFTKGNYVGLAVFMLLGAYNHHMNALFAATVALAGWLMILPSARRGYVYTLLLVVLLYLPHLGVTLYQLGVGGIGRNQGGWLEAPDRWALVDLLKILIGTGRMYWVIGLAVFFAYLDKKKVSFTKKQLVLFGLFAFNFLIVFLYSVFRAPVYQTSVMLFSGMAFLVALTAWMEYNRKAIFYLMFFSLVASLFTITYVNKDYFHSAVKTVYEYQFTRTLEYKQKYGKEEVFPVFVDSDKNMRTIYFDKLHTSFPFSSSADSASFSLRHFAKLVSSLKASYLVLSSALPAQQAIAKQYFPYLIENTQTQGILYKVYSKRQEDQGKTVEDDQILLESHPSSPRPFAYKPAEGLITGRQMVLDSLQEFPFETKAPYKEVLTKEGQVVLASASLHMQKKGGAPIELCVSVNGEKDGESLAYTAHNSEEVVTDLDSNLVIYTDYFAGTNHRQIRKRASIACYLWNRGKNAAVLKDFTVKVVDYWPQKWNFWK